MESAHQAFKFILTDFTSGWDRRLRTYGVIEYRPLTNGSKLKVVASGPTGDLKTYFYHVPARQKVIVIQDIIHIPARAYEQHIGNKIGLEEV